MRAICSLFSIGILISFFITGCKQEMEELNHDPLSDYLPLQAGKYITYRLDSTVFTQNGRKEEIHSYQEKHLIDQQITDNLGRIGYRVFRFIRDTAGVTPWVSAGTYFIVPNDTAQQKITNTIEVVENNLRFVRLSLPVKEARSWKGNGYLPTNPYESKYEFNNDLHIYLEDWDYTYENVGASETLNGKTYNNVITINGPDESANANLADPKTYASKTFFSEKYAKGIGLIYHETVLWEYQPALNSNQTAYKTGFGVKRTIIDRN